MSKTPDPDSPAKLPEPRLPAPKLLAKKDEPAAASEPRAEAAASASPSADVPPSPDNDAGRVRSDTFAQRKADARDVGIDTAFMDELTSDLVLDGVPDHLRPGGAAKSDNEATAGKAAGEDDALDADALFDAPPPSASSGAIPPPAPAAADDPLGAGAAVLAASIEKEEAAKSGSIESAAEPEGVSIPPPVSRAAPKAAAATGSDAPLNPATLAIGGAILAIVLLLVFKTCAGSGTDEAGDRTAAAARPGGAAAAEAGAAEAGAAEGGAAGGAAGGGAAEGAGAGGAAEGGAADDAAEAGGGAAAGGDAAEDGEEAGAQEGAADEEGQADAGSDGAAQEAAAAEGGSEAGEVAIVDESDDGAGADERPSGSKSGGGGGPSAMPASSGETDPDRAAEAQMSAEELLAKAKESLKHKRYRDAYRQSTSSYHKKKTDAALEVRVESACGMNNKNAAKSSFDKVSGMSTRRDLRSKCRDHGVRLGL